MTNLNLIGNLVRDPESRTTQKGDVVCTFTVASNRRFPVNGERVTDFYRINAWRGLGETCQKFLSKGSKVYIRGELQPRLYDDKNGETRLSLDVDAEAVEFLSPRGESEATPAPSAPSPASAPIDTSSDDLPF